MSIARFQRELVMDFFNDCQVAAETEMERLKLELEKKNSEMERLKLEMLDRKLDLEERKADWKTREAELNRQILFAKGSLSSRGVFERYLINIQQENTTQLPGKFNAAVVCAKLGKLKKGSTPKMFSTSLSLIAGFLQDLLRKFSKTPS